MRPSSSSAPTTRCAVCRRARREKNLSAILEKLKAAHVPVLLCGMKAPRNLGPDYAKTFDPIYAALAKKYDVLLYPFFLDGVAMDPKLNQADGIHPNPAGVKIIVARMLPYVKKLVGRSTAKTERRRTDVPAPSFRRRLHAAVAHPGFTRDILMAAMLGAGTHVGCLRRRLPVSRIIFAPSSARARSIPPSCRAMPRSTRDGELRSGHSFGDAGVLLADGGAAGHSGRGAGLHALDRAGPCAGLCRQCRHRCALTAHLARITFPYLILTVVAVQLSAMLNAMEKFAAAAAWPVLLNVAMIPTLASRAPGFRTPPKRRPGACSAGGVLQLVFIRLGGQARGARSAHRHGRAGRREIKEFFVAFGAVTLRRGQRHARRPSSTRCSRAFCQTGSRTALYYADRIDNCRLGVLGIALGTVLLPEMSAQARASATRKGSDAAQNRAAALSLLLIAAFLGGLRRHSRHDHARDLRPWRLQPSCRGAGGHRAHAPMASGLPAFAMMRIVHIDLLCPPRHDDARAHDGHRPSPINIAMKVVLVWGLGFGIGGIALGTAIRRMGQCGHPWLMLGRTRAVCCISTRSLLACAAADPAGRGVSAGGGALCRTACRSNAAARRGTLQDMVAFGTGRCVWGSRFYLAVAYIVPRPRCRLAGFRAIGFRRQRDASVRWLCHSRRGGADAACCCRAACPARAGRRASNSI